MLPMLARSGVHCLRQSRTPLISALRPSLSSAHRLSPLSSSLTSLRRNSSLPPPPSSQHVTGLASELVEPHPSPVTKPRAPPSLIDKIVPKWAEGAKPYLHLIRIDKPIGSLLLFWPCTWGITMAASVNHLAPSVPAYYIALFGLGAVIMRGAGCIINDMWDMKFDKAVERTQWRPLAAGDVTMTQAFAFLGTQLSLGLMVLTQLNTYSIILGASSLALVTIYPFMKRVTYYPQITFGLTFSWGILLGWSAVAGAVDWTIALPMYFGNVIYGVMYDCIYAHQDKVDDVKAGVKSIALAFPDNSRALISTLSTGFISSLALTGYLAGLGPLYYAISCGATGAHLAWQCATVDFDSRADCWKKFCSNGYLGGVVWLGIAADYLQNVVLPGLF